MKKELLLIALLINSLFAAQIGINTNVPKATLDVVGKKGSTDIDGLISPRLTRAELTAKGNSLYGADQDGTIVYITDVSSGDELSQRVNITVPGYYYFDAPSNVWKKVTSKDELSREPWNIVNTTTPSYANNQSIYQNANVGIGDFISEIPTAKLDVNGDAFIRTDLGIKNSLYFNPSSTITPDVSLSRIAPYNLQVQSVLTTRNNGMIGTVNIQSYDAINDTMPSFSVNKSGVITFGPGGTTSTDVRISRGGPGWLRLQSTMLSISKGGPIDTTPAIRLSSTDLNSITNPNPMFEVMVSGKLRWGAGTSYIPDINLERDATTSKLKLTGTAYSGTPGNRYLLIDPGTGLISMSTASASSVAKNSNTTSNMDYDIVIEDLKQKLKQQSEKINQLEIILNKITIVR